MRWGAMKNRRGAKAKKVSDNFVEVKRVEKPTDPIFPATVHLRDSSEGLTNTGVLSITGGWKPTPVEPPTTLTIHVKEIKIVDKDGIVLVDDTVKNFFNSYKKIIFKDFEGNMVEYQRISSLNEERAKYEPVVFHVRINGVIVPITLCKVV
jgi:hypothetical protein